MKDAETQAVRLIDGILEANERAKLIEAILDQAERDRAILEDHYLVKSEEAAFLRQKDVLESMRQLELLQNDERMLEAFRKYDNQRGDAINRAIGEMVEGKYQGERAKENVGTCDGVVT